MKILFHDNSLCLYGTTVALYDYAFYCRKLFNAEVSVLYNSTHFANDNKVISKFISEFSDVNSYSNFDEMHDLISQTKPDAFFMVKCGQWDEVISKVSKNFILAISPHFKQTYGDKFAVASYWISEMTGEKNVVPHMVNLPKINEDLRVELGIPKDAIVFGRTGSDHEFGSINFVIPTVLESLRLRKDIWFLFQNTNKFVEHERVIYLPPNDDKIFKVKFINTCDALLHARFLGESFGLVCAEFSSRNKPVITWFGSEGRNHILVLGQRGIYYNNYEELLKILINFEPDQSKDWNCYRDYYPDPVMERFKNYYLS